MPRTLRAHSTFVTSAFGQPLSFESLEDRRLLSADVGYTVDVLVAVPLDDSVDPVVDCPGLDDDGCLPGDADSDGDVDFSDFLAFSTNYGQGDASWQEGDFDGDGLVTFQDFGILAENYGQTY